MRGWRFTRDRLWPLLVATAFVLLAGPVLGAEKVGIETGLHDGFGRIVFAWPEPIKFVATIGQQGLTIKFERPLHADLALIAKQLPHYVEGASMDGDSTVLVTLKHPVGLHTLALGKRASIDLVDPGGPAAQAQAKPAPVKAPAKPHVAAVPAPTAAAKPAADKPTLPQPQAVAVKRIDEDGVHRLVFEWPKPTEYNAKVVKGEATIHFKQAGAIDGEQLAAAAPELSPRVTPGRDDLTVRLKLPTGSKLHVHRKDNLVFLDLTPGPQAKSAAAAPAKPIESPPAQAAAAAQAKPAATSPPTPLTPSQAPPQAAATPPAPTDEAEAKPVQTVAPPASREQAAREQAARDQAAREAKARDAAPLALRYANGDAGATMRFEWNKPVGAAVFRRGAHLWIVFGAPLVVDLADLKAKGQVAVTTVRQVQHPAATILRLTTLKGFNPSIRRAETAWIVELTPQLLQPDSPIGVSLQPAAQPPRAFFTVREPNEPVVFRDPEIGDNLVVVPVGQVGQGVAREERLVDFTSMLTAQGIALRPNDDSVTTRIIGTGVEVSGPAGLTLSSEKDRARRRNEAQPRLFELSDWFGARDGDFLARRRALQLDIVAAAPVSRSGTRLDLARFYFAHGYGPEALGVIEAIQHDDPSFAADPRVRAMTGGAMLLAGDQEGAARELGLHALDDEHDIALWRGSLAYAKRDWPRAAAEFGKGEALLPTYPKLLRNRFALEAAEALLATGQHDDAEHYIDFVLKDAPSAGDRAAARLLTGRVLELAGDAEQARGVFDKLASGEDRPTRARATLARTLADLESGALPRGEAIEKLDALRFAWRGDDFEMNLLRHLGELKLKDGDYRGGLEALHQAMANFPDHPDHRAITQQTTDAFTDLFIGPQAENVPPLKALSLYEEYHELTPAGAKGDEIIEKLVDRLVGVDLLDRAATLLENQVQFRLSGKDKARVATRLALVQLLDRKPNAALATLDGAAAPNAGRDIPAELLRQRQQLRARALLELRRGDEALAILGDDRSVAADQLRADIYWRDKNWAEVAKTFARLAEVARVREGQLDEEAARNILNWGTALTLAGDQPGIAKLAATYGTAMEASPFRDAFRVISGGGVASSGDIRQLAGKVAQVADLQGFMASYRERLAKQKLSAIN
jgi:tetratricopeptide (TPR) repeat protein